MTLLSAIVLFLPAVCGFVSTLPRASPRVTPRASPSATLIDWSGFISPSLEADLITNWDNADSIVAAANAREDMFGIVGGSYLMLDGLLMAAVVVAVVMSFEFKKGFMAAAEEETALTDAGFVWKAGIALPTLEELSHSCAIIGEEFG